MATRRHTREAARMAVLLSQLDLIAAALHQSNIPLIALKNAGIARGIYPCAACCPMGDLDVLVPKSRFIDAHHIVLAQGYTLATRGTVEAANLEEGLRSGGTEYVKTVDGEEVWFELQWRAVSGRWLTQDQEPNSDELIARSVPIEGTHVRLLCPEDNLLQVSLHTAKHSYVRAPGVRLHTDVDRIVAYTPPNWQVFVDRVRALHVCTPTYFSLAIAEALLHTPIPPWVLEALAPPRWKIHAVTRMIKKAGIFNPDEQKFSRPEMLVFHALLYDDLRGFAASALDTRRDELTLGNLPQHVRRGARRIHDLVTRYQA